MLTWQYADNAWATVRGRTTVYQGHIQQHQTVPVQVGGKDGLYDEEFGEAAVPLDDGSLAVFDLSAPQDTTPTVALTDILETVEWAPDPGSDATWRPSGDWVK